MPLKPSKLHSAPPAFAQRNTVVVGDCLEVLRALPDNCVDLVFTSPPYENARTYGVGFNLKGEDWVEWCKPRFMECLRVCKGLVAWVIEGTTKDFEYSATPLLLAADLYRSGVILRKPPIYRRVGIPGSGGPDWLRNDYEMVLCATSGGKLLWSNNTACGAPPKYTPGGTPSHRMRGGERINATLKKVKRDEKLSARTKKEQVGDTTVEYQSYVPPAIANPGNIIDCHGGGGHLGSKLAHENEAPFPESLAEFFVKSFCPPGGVVLDPFCGSGTVGAVALCTQRNYLLVDVRDSQRELTLRRLAEVRNA